MRGSLRWAVQTFLGALLAAVLSCARGAGEHDILFLTIDTLRADYLGCAGARVRTPALDSLAAAGCRFEQAVTAVPLTLPSHCTMMTGLYPHHHGVRVNEHYLGSDRTTLAEIMKREGYTTAAFVGGFPLAAQFGLARGFDHYDDRFESPAEASLPVEHRFRRERRAAEVVDAALAWMDHAKPRRLFLWVHLYDPHDPYEAPPPWRAGYEGEIEYTDHEVGRLLGEIRKRGRTPQLVLVAGDHGEGLGEHQEPNHGLFIYDSTMRVPLLMAGRGIQAGARVRSQVALVDLLPTVAELCGASIPAGLDGVSLAGLVRGKAPEPTTGPQYIESLYALGMGWAPLRGVRTGEWKYIEAPQRELYNLQADAPELNNIYNGEPRRAALQAEALGRLRGGEVAPGGRVNEEQMAALRSLGYLSGADTGDKSSGIDPKTRVDVAQELSHANALEVAGQYGEAIAAFEQIRKEDPENPFVLLRLGTLNQRAGRIPDALGALRTARRKDPSSSEICYQLGETFFRAGQADSAITWYRRSLDLTPGRTTALANLGVCLLQKGGYAEAKELLSQAAAKLPDDGRVLGNLGLAELMLGNFDASHGLFLRSREILGPEFHYHYELGMVLLRRREVEPALREFAATQGRRRPDALIELAVAARVRGQVPQAISLLEEAIQLGGDRVRQQIASDRRLAPLRGTADGARIFGPR